jgi:hypothetical protein
LPPLKYAGSRYDLVPEARLLATLGVPHSEEADFLSLLAAKQII